METNFEHMRMSASEIAYMIAIDETAKNCKTGEAMGKSVAEKRNLSRASTSRALDKLCAKKLLMRTEKKGYVLTDRGREVIGVYESCIRRVKEELAIRFGCRDAVAYEDALRIVCALSGENLSKLAKSEGEKCF